MTNWYGQNRPTRFIHRFNLLKQATRRSPQGGFTQKLSGTLNSIEANRV